MPAGRMDDESASSTFGPKPPGSRSIPWGLFWLLGQQPGHFDRSFHGPMAPFTPARSPDTCLTTRSTAAD